MLSGQIDWTGQIEAMGQHALPPGCGTDLSSGFSRTLDDRGPSAAGVIRRFQGNLGRFESEKRLHHRKCGRTG